MKLFDNFFDRKKDWRLNRRKFELCTFTGFHHMDTSLNLLFDKLAVFLNNDFSSFTYFGPYGLTKDSLRQGFDVEKHILEVRINHPIFSVSFENEDGAGEIKYVGVCPFDLPTQNTTFVSIQYFADTKHPDFLNLVHPETFYFASYSENDYINWQSNDGVVENYKYRGGLKYTKNKYGEKSVDISDRPGRMVFTKYFNYCGASKIWFGPLIFQYIPQELILAFEGAVEIKILENNITYVHLYEDVYDGNEPKSQEVQKEFRDHIKIDGLKVEL